MRTPQNLPVITIVVVAFSALAHCLPGMSAVLAYNREAILSGEWWRLLTGHWIHFSTSHFLFDTAAFAIAGCLIEHCRYKNFGWHCIASAMAISLAMFLCEPRLKICGGLSGMATAAFVFLALHGLQEKGAWRSFCAMLLGLCAAKLMVELASGKFLFVRPPQAFLPVPINHVAGAFSAVIVWAWSNCESSLARRTVKAQIV